MLSITHVQYEVVALRRQRHAALDARDELFELIIIGRGPPNVLTLNGPPSIHSRIE